VDAPGPSQTPATECVTELMTLSRRPPSWLGKRTPPPQIPSLGASLLGASILAPVVLVFQPEPYQFLKCSGAHGHSSTDTTNALACRLASTAYNWQLSLYTALMTYICMVLFSL